MADVDGDRTSVELTVLIPTYNERRHLDEVVERIRAQRIPGSVEFLFIDGRSDDGTREALVEVVREDPRMRLIDNPERRTPNALNLGLAAARGEFIARMDAHTLYPPDYLAIALERLRQGDVAWVNGPALPRGTGRWSRRIALALESRIGVGSSPFRRLSSTEIDSDTGFTGILRRSTLEALGGWDEGWPINQDGELAARVRAGDGRIVCLPALAAHYIPRDSPRALARQYLRYGFYKAKTCRRHPTALRPPLVLPPLLVLGLVTAAAPGRIGRLARGGAASYGALLVANAGRKRRDGAPRDVASLPMLWGIMHIAWGTGFLAGCARFGPPLRGLARAFRVAR
jgi:glycosyltransferase involved in cell wall biosynthesis